MALTPIFCGRAMLCLEDSREKRRFTNTKWLSIGVEFSWVAGASKALSKLERIYAAEHTQARGSAETIILGLRRRIVVFRSKVRFTQLFPF